MPHLTVWQDLWALLAGLVTGALFGLVGGGGSIVAIPIMTSLVGLTRVRVAMGTTAVAVALTAGLSAVLHARRGQVAWPYALAFTLPGIVGVTIGGRLQNDLPTHLLLTLLGVVMLFNATFLVSLSSAQTASRAVPKRRQIWLRVVPSGLAVGLLAGLFGTGGGFLALPSMMLGGLSLSAAVGSSVVSVGSLGVASALHYSLKGLVDWRVVAVYGAGGLFGSTLVMPLAGRLAAKRRAMSYGLALTLTALALYLIAHNAVRLLYTGGRVV
ncbi:MAG: sulfite exporter TauE/SafE family protein [Firmicutes bacterium]|nr:sulfite exporter TauE/SafE family protein [Bacillota bacterium]